MPIYSIRCKDCNAKYEIIADDKTKLECISCGSKELKKETIEKDTKDGCPSNGCSSCSGCKG